MADSRQISSQFREWFNELIAPSEWEAPDRKYAGHRDILTRSLARYQFVSPFIRGFTLEIGCGRGYGLEIFESKDISCIGVDLSLKFLEQAKAQLPTRSLVQANGSKIPMAGDLFDAIIAFEVIEHIHEDVGFLVELERLSKERGVVLISTPNKAVASGRSPTPLDRFHQREYTYQEFLSVLGTVFQNIKIYGQSDRSAVIDEGRPYFLDRIPIRWKYVLPASIQGYISLLARTPIKLSDCVFDQINIESAHTFIAICQK